MNLILRLLTFLLFIPFYVSAQVQLSDTHPSVLIDFSATMPTGVGSNPPSAFGGRGFEPNTDVEGRLNSNAWEISGLQFGELHFGDVQTVDAFGRGTTNWPSISPGIYAYTEQPGSSDNPSMLIQPGEEDFTPGYITLRIQNTSATAMTSLLVDYDVLLRNDGTNSVHLDFAYSLNNSSFTTVPSMRYTTPSESDSSAYTYVGISPTHQYAITGINITTGNYIYLRWSISDAGGTGAYDEIGLDNIYLNGTFGSAYPILEITTGTNLVLSNHDDQPTAAKSTLMSTASSPISTINSSATIPIMIKNKGTANLNITSVTVTGANPADFTIFMSSGSPTGIITPLGTTNSSKTFFIKFTPTAAGYRTARITINSNDVNHTPFWFDVAGYGRVPQPDITVKSLTGLVNIISGSMVATAANGCLWNDVNAGAYVDKSFRITNDGHVGVQLLLNGTPPIQIEGANPDDFVVTVQPAMLALHAGFQSTFTVRFSPKASGIRTAIVRIPNNDVVPDPASGQLEDPFTFLVQGNGRTPEIDVTGNTISIPSGSTAIEVVNNTDFDSLQMGNSTTRMFAITNSGVLPLTIANIQIQGDAAADFAITTNPAATINTNGSSNLVVTFTPSAIGERLATVVITSNDPDEGTYTFAIRGYGADFMPCQMTAVSILGNQLFETATTAPNWTYTGGTLASANGFGSNGDSGTSPRYLGARSLQVNNQTSTITMGAINTSTYDFAAFTLRLGAYATSATEGMGEGDAVHIEVSTNGGSTFTRELSILGSNASKWSFNSGTGIINIAYTGSGVSQVFTAGENFATTTGYSAIRLTGLPSANSLIIRLVVVSTSAARVWALDDFRFLARQYNRTVWNGSSWSNGAPAIGKKVVINGNLTTTAAGIEACECDINAGATLTVNSGHTLAVESNLKVLGNLVIENNGSLIQRDNHAVNTGSITYKRNTMPVRRYDYTYWSSPVENQVLNVFSPLTLFDKYFSFNSVANDWLLEAPGNTMQVGRGYIIRAPQTFSITAPAVFNGQFVGKPNNGEVTYAVTGAANNMQLLGNPYPSAIAAEAFILDPTNAGLINGTLYFWTHNTPLTNYNYTASDYATYNLLGGTGTSSPIAGANNTTPNGYIAAGQAFVTLTRGSNGNARFDNRMRVSGQNTQFYRQSESLAGSATTSARVWLSMMNDVAEYKEILIGYTPQATLGYDYGYDGELVDNQSEMRFYSGLDDLKLTIQGRPSFDVNDRVALGVEGLPNTPYRIDLARVEGLSEEQAIYIEDAYTHTVHNLRIAPYEFTLTGDEQNRFYLRYAASTLGTGDWQINDQVAIIRTSTGLEIRALQAISEMRIYNLQGQLVSRMAVNATEAQLNLEHLAKQMLLIEIQVDHQSLLYKKFMW